MREMSLPRRGVTALSLLTIFHIGGPAAAADNSPHEGEALEEVTVTAQRRAERLQEVPISAHVIGARVLTQQNLVSLADLAQTVPSVHIESAGRSSEIYIRGIGSGQNQAFDQSVGMFIDDIYHGRSRTSVATFLDLDRVEILKGPQTTFFGNNAIAGAFNIVTAKPGNVLEAWSRVFASPRGGTNGGQYAVEGAIGGPVTDTLGVRVAATYNGQEGWLENVNTGNRVPKLNNLAGRVTLVFKPTEDLDATWKIEGSRNRNTGTRPEQLINCPPPPPFKAAGFCATVLGLKLPTGLDQNKNGESGGQGVDLDTHESVLTLNYQLLGQTLTSVTGYYGYDFNLKLDIDETPLTLLNAQVPERYHQFSQEFRIASPTGGPIEYLAGLYFQTDGLSFRQDFNYSFQSGRIRSTPALAPLVAFLPVGLTNDYSQTERSYSAFGSLTWNALKQLKLSAGLRASRVQKSYDWGLLFGTATQDWGGIAPLPAAVAPVANGLGLGTAGTLSGSRSDSALMPSGRIQYQIAPSAMTYFSYSRGFKAGGFNGTDTTGQAANLPFAPEHVDAYELGLKSEWFNNRVLMNLAVFRSDYSDLQSSVSIVTSAGALQSLVKNAAASRSQGVELEGQWAISESFRLAANATYLDAYYVSYPNVTPTALQTLQGLRVQDLSGRPTQFSPDWSGSLTATYSTAMLGEDRLTMELNSYFSSKYYVAAVDDDLIGRQNGYVRLDARLTFETADRRWAFDVLGRNLTNQDIAIFANAVPTSLGTGNQVKEQPRSYGFQVRYHW
jgi:outer membrane receptor protein involved in Fe transport